jgi:D-sedoheptulose 7-phosphate isomerase
LKGSGAVLRELLGKQIDEHLKMIGELQADLDVMVRAGELIARCLADDRKVLLCGNGGSAAEAQHIAAELVGRYRVERSGLAAIALSTDTSTLTAVGNDYGFQRVFARQVGALGRPGDVLIAISTSGNSENVVEAARAGRVGGLQTIGLSGGDGGSLRGVADLLVLVPHHDTARIQEAHTLIGHLLCTIVEEVLPSAGIHR